MSAEIRSFRDLHAWQRAYALGRDVYELTRGFPREEVFGLTSQLRRGAVSVASNIAEGYGRGTTDDYLRFLRVARGSLFEVDTQLEFSRDFGYLAQPAHEGAAGRVEECGRVLAGLIRSLERHSCS